MESVALDLDDIYFGSKRCYFGRAAGRVVEFRSESWVENFCNEAVTRVCERAEPLLEPGKSVADVVVPGIPALEIVCVAEGGAPELLSPELLRQPLIKVNPAKSAVVLEGRASGTRSAVAKIDGTWYRLKGCGNHDEGFPVRTQAATPTEGAKRDIRGCAFPDTAIRELAMAARVNLALAPEGVCGTNEAVGMMLYSSPEHLPLGPTFPTACIVEKTLGDRRLGTHIMTGLLVLLPRLVDADKLDGQALLDTFPAARPRSSNGNVVSTSSLMMNLQLGASFRLIGDRENMTFSQALDCHLDGIRCDGTVLGDFVAHSSSGAAANKVIAEAETAPRGDDFPRQFTNSGARDMDARWQEVWADNCSQLENALTRGPRGSSSLLVYLFSRLGFDAGRCTRGLHQQRLSWGTYQDAICTHAAQWHCNAHSNNLVLNSEGLIPAGQPGADSLLSLLDLDMAFDERSYVDAKTKKVGQEPDEFSRLLIYEALNLLEVLQGDADTTSGVPTVARALTQEAIGDNSPPKLNALGSALRDSLSLGFLRGYTGDAESYPVVEFDPDMHQAAHIICRLAICIMAEFIA